MNSRKVCERVQPPLGGARQGMGHDGGGDFGGVG